jgi:hypothetical protein
MADIADVCEVDRDRQCDFELRQETEIDDPSIGIIPEIESGPVLAGPPVVTGPLTQCSVAQFQQYNFRPLTNFTDSVAAAAAAAAVDAESAPTEIEQREREGFVESDEVSSNTTEDITTGTDNPLLVSFQIMEFIESQIKKDLLGPFNTVFEALYKGLLDVVPNLHDVNATKGFVGINRCGFLSKYTTVIYYAGRIPFSHRLAIVTLIENCNTHIKEIIEKWPVGGNIAFTCKVEKSPVQYDTQKIILCIRLATNNVIQIPILNVVGFPVFEDVNPLLRLLECVNPQSLPIFCTPQAQGELQFLSLLDIIVRVRLCANHGAITALSEPSKEEVTLILSCFKGLTDRLPELIPTITQSIRTTLYTDANIKPFALFCNIFYNFINVSLGHRSLAKIIYSDFFSKSDNYGKVIRACQAVNNLPIMLHHVAFFLTGSNAARVYLALNKILKNWEAIQRDLRLLTQILNETFGNLSDNDFMIYLKGPESEEYRVFIRMILGGSFYFFKDLFDPVTLAQFTAMMTQSAGIVGFMDHLFAQRFDATWQFLLECYQKDPTSFLAHIQPLMAEYFQHLDKQINVAQFDGVFKHYTLKGFYTKMFEICGITAPDYVYVFLIDHATSINCIATVWTLVLNVLYTLFVPENCLARMVVGKFDNDPKNLKLYMEILNDHLTELQSLPIYTATTRPGIVLLELLSFQTEIARMCQDGINHGPDVFKGPEFKKACDNWVQTMVICVSQTTSQHEFRGLFMLSESDASTQGGRPSTKLERALCLAYLPTSRGNICSAASPTGPYIFIEQILKIVDLNTTHIEGILSSDYAKTLATEDMRMDLLQRLKNGGVNDGNLNRLILNPDSLQKDPFLVPVNEATIFIDLFKKAPRKPLISLSGTDNLAEILTSLNGNNAVTTTLLERLKHFGVNDDNLKSLGDVESSLIQKKFGMQEPLAKAFIGLCRQQLPIAGIVDQSEIELYPRLTALGSQMKVFLEATRTISITIKPEITTSQLSNYLNLLWKHLTKTAIDLKIFFKENLTDIKRVTGIKFIALVLGGYFQIRLLVDDVSDQCRPDKRGELESFKTSQQMFSCKRGLLPLLIEPNLIALIKAIIQMDRETGTDYTDPIPIILKILGFLFSIKVKSSSPHSPYQLLRLEDSILIFPFPKDPPDPRGLQILNPTSGMFIDFLRALGVPINKETMKCICRPKDDVLKIDIGFSQALKSYNLEGLYTAMGGGNNLESNSGRKSVSSLNKHKHKYKHNKLSRNNHTRKNKYKRNNKNKNKKHKSSTKYRKINPSSRSGSQSNKKKSKSKITHKSVTFKRRMYNK